MALKFGDSVVADPQLADVERAIETAPREAGWRINLDNGEDDHMEAVASPAGLYAVTFVDRGQRFNAAAAVDANGLKDILCKYLNGDTDWRDGANFVAEQAPGARARAARRITSKPPTWAIALVAGSFFGMPLIVRWLPKGGPDDYGWLTIAVIVGGPMAVLLLAMIVNKLLQLRRVAGWPQAAGRVTKSAVATRHQRPSGKATQLINFPAIEYEFAANGQTYTGKRIAVGEDTGGANIEATLARYPVGAAVAVYYDPSDPENCVLERGAPALLPVQGCGTTLTSLAAIGFCGYWLVKHYDSAIAPMWATGHGRVSLLAAIVGALSLMAYFGSLIIAKQNEQPWSSVNGTIVDSRTESDNRGRQTRYAPVVEYAYLVHERQFHGRTIASDDQGELTLAEAEKIAARYPKGSPAVIYYDPKDPRDAMLERPSANRANRAALAVAVVSFLVAVYASGYFRS